MSKNSRQILYGILLILVSGTVLFLNIRAFESGFKQLWPFLVLVAGLVLAVAAFAGRSKRPLLIAAGVFLCFASVFLFLLAASSWQNLFFLWPGFLLSSGAGLASYTAFGGGKRAWQIPALVLVVAALLSWVLYTVKSRYGLAVGVTVFLAGGYFLARGTGLELEGKAGAVLEAPPEEKIAGEPAGGGEPRGTATKEPQALGEVASFKTCRSFPGSGCAGARSRGRLTVDDITGVPAGQAVSLRLRRR